MKVYLSGRRSLGVKLCSLRAKSTRPAASTAGVFRTPYRSGKINFQLKTADRPTMIIVAASRKCRMTHSDDAENELS